jgi:hypothetical protein
MDSFIVTYGLSDFGFWMMDAFTVWMFEKVDVLYAFS